MTHGLHIGVITGFVHAHHMASIIAATAVVGGGAAGAAWHSSQPTSTPPTTTAARTSHHARQHSAQMREWMSHHRAYQTHLAWLDHHSYRDGHWMAHYRGYHHELGWMLGHRGYARGRSIGNYRADTAHFQTMHHQWMWTRHTRAYHAQLAWMLHHRSYQNRQWLHHYNGYRHELGWMLGHRAYAPYGHMIGRYRAYQTRMHWLRDHWTWNGPQTRRLDLVRAQPHLDEPPHGRRLADRPLRLLALDSLQKRGERCDPTRHNQSSVHRPMPTLRRGRGRPGGWCVPEDVAFPDRAALVVGGVEAMGRGELEHRHWWVDVGAEGDSAQS